MHVYPVHAWRPEDGCMEARRRVLDPLELQLQSPANIWVLGTEIRSSERAANTLLSHLPSPSQWHFSMGFWVMFCFVF